MVGTFSPIPRGAGDLSQSLTASDFSNPAYVMKPPEGPPNDRVQRILELANNLRGREGGVPREDTETLCPSPLPYPVRVFHLAVPELYPLSYTSNISPMLS